MFTEILMINMLNIINTINNIPYFEIVPFIPATALVLMAIIMVTIKTIGPIPAWEDFSINSYLNLDKNGQFDENNNKIKLNDNSEIFKYGVSRHNTIAAIQFFVGWWIIFIQILTILGLSTKPQWTPSYLHDSNKLGFMLLIFLFAFILMLEQWWTTSKYDIIVYGGSFVLITIAWTMYFLNDQVSVEDFLSFSIEIIVGFGFIIWIINTIIFNKAKKTINGDFTEWSKSNLFKLLKPIYSKNKKVGEKISSAKFAWLYFLMVSVVYMMTWTDIPFF